MKFFKKFFKNQNIKKISKLVEKNEFIFKKTLKRLGFIRKAYKRVNEACEFKKIGVKRGKSSRFSIFFN